METEGRFYVIEKEAVPEVLLKVVEAKRLLESGRRLTIREVTERLGISRSSFYKYRDSVFPFNDSARGKTINLSVQILDEPGILSNLLNVVAEHHANILTIHQSIPVNGIASVSLSVEVLTETGNPSLMVERMRALGGVSDVRLLARE